MWIRCFYPARITRLSVRKLKNGFGEGVTVLDPAEATALQARIFPGTRRAFKNCRARGAAGFALRPS